MENKISSWLGEELQGVSLPDKRFSANVISIAEHLDEQVGLSFSGACGDRLRKSAWRLFSGEELDLLSVHQHRTFTRCAAQSIVLVAEDTTDIVYRQQQKQGMGNLGGNVRRAAKGLNIHTALALTDSGEPLGIIHQQIWAPKADKAGTNRSHLPIEEKETIKWINTLKAVNKCWQTEQQQQVVVIGDREADFFEHYAYPKQDNINLLVRVQQKKRKVVYNGQQMTIAEVLDRLQPSGKGEIKIWRKPNQPQRTAEVFYYAATITLPPPADKKQLASRTMQLVCVRETGAERDNKTEWILLTDLLADTIEDAIKVCSYYSLRWVIERYHHILKSGLAIEKVQMDNFTRLANALQLYALIGWHLLWLQRLAKTHGSEEAANHIDEETIEIMETVTGQKIKTAADFMIVTAVLGGFISTKKQPLPGEKTLWLGLRQLYALQKGFRAAKQKYGTG